MQDRKSGHAGIAHWERIAEGVTSHRITLKADASFEIDVAPRSILWLTCIEGSAMFHESAGKNSKELGEGDSSLFLRPGGAWKVIASTSAPNGLAEIAAFRITFAALHDMLAVEFTDDDHSEDRSDIDYSKLLRTVHFGPSRIRDLGRIFIHAHDSRFKNLAKKGVFFDVFAEMLEKLYGTDMTQCPFHIDAETERKIRYARQLLVHDLKVTPDFTDICVEVELPQPVLKEGFQYVYGSSMQGYLSNYKFDRARVMLESGKYLIKEVAFEVGYQNPSHFISSFKQRFGLTPKQWVKQQTA